MHHKLSAKTFPVFMLCLLVLTGCPPTKVARVPPTDQTPPDVTLVITFTDLVTGKTETRHVASPHTSGDVAVEVRVPPVPLPPKEPKGVELTVQAIATDPQGVGHLRIMRTAAPGAKWKGEPPGPIIRFSDDARAKEELRGTLVLSQQGSTVTLFAEAFNLGPGALQSQTAKLIISTK